MSKMPKQKVKLSYKQKGNKLYKQEEYGLAAAMYRKHIRSIKQSQVNQENKQYQDIDKAYHNMALCSFKLKNYEDCIQECKNCLSFNKKYTKAYYRLALAYQQLQNNYECYRAASQYCRSESQANNSGTKQYRQMHDLKMQYEKLICEAEPFEIDNRNNIIYETNKDKKQDKQKKAESAEIIMGDSNGQMCGFKIVKELLKSKQYMKAVNILYCMLNGVIGREPRRNFKENVIKFIQQKIRNYNQSIDIDQYWDNALAQAQQYLQQKSQQTTKTQKITTTKNKLPQLPPSDSVIQQNKQKPVEQNAETPQQKAPENIYSLEECYEKYFLMALKSYDDLFQGFFQVLIEILTNKWILKKIKSGHPQNLLRLLEMIGEKYEMFEVLQQSLSKKQTTAIQEKMKQALADQEALVMNNMINKYCK